MNIPDRVFPRLYSAEIPSVLLQTHSPGSAFARGTQSVCLAERSGSACNSAAFKLSGICFAGGHGPHPGNPCLNLHGSQEVQVCDNMESAMLGFVKSSQSRRALCFQRHHSRQMSLHQFGSLAMHPISRSELDNNTISPMLVAAALHLFSLISLRSPASSD